MDLEQHSPDFILNPLDNCANLLRLMEQLERPPSAGFLRKTSSANGVFHALEDFGIRAILDTETKKITYIIFLVKERLILNK